MLRSTTSTTTRSFRNSPDSDANHTKHPIPENCVTEDPGERMANGHTDAGDNDDSDCVSIIDCQMVNGDGPQHADPEYYFDEDTGQIIVSDQVTIRFSTPPSISN